MTHKYTKINVYSHLTTDAGQTQLPPRVRNIGYLGQSYNIFIGNPHNTHGEDPGLTGKPVFALSYNQRKTTPDGCYSIPDYTSVEDASACSFTFSSNSVHNVASYFMSLKTDVTTSFGGYGASFSASTDYNMVKKNTASQESRYVKSHAICEDYWATLLQGAELDDSFKTAVEDLDSNEEYRDFVQQYGTHYLATVTMGGRYGFQSEFETNEYMDMLSNGLDISVAAKYSERVSVGVNLSTQFQTEMANEFNSHRESYGVYEVGGKPPITPNGTAMAWAQTVQNNPLPIRYQLEEEIADLFTKSYFDNDSNIETKRGLLKKAITHYCEYDLSLTFCNIDGPDSDDSIRIVLSNTTEVKQIDLFKIPWFYHGH